MIYDTPQHIHPPISCNTETIGPAMRARVQFELDITLPDSIDTRNRITVEISTLRGLQKVLDLPRYESDIWWVSATPCNMAPDRWDHM
jgi:hypothetical protein